jgi:hypothetical protein
LAPAGLVIKTKRPAADQNSSAPSDHSVVFRGRREDDELDQIVRCNSRETCLLCWLCIGVQLKSPGAINHFSLPCSLIKTPKILKLYDDKYDNGDCQSNPAAVTQSHSNFRLPHTAFPQVCLDSIRTLSIPLQDLIVLQYFGRIWPSFRPTSEQA